MTFVFPSQTDADPSQQGAVNPPPSTGEGNASSSSGSSFVFPSQLDGGNGSANPETSTTADIAKTVPSALARGVEGLIGLPGDVEQGFNFGTQWAVGRALQTAGNLPAGQSASDYANAQLAKIAGVRQQAASATGINADLPTSSDVQGAAQAVGVPNYQPQTATGKYINSVAEAVPGVLAAPEKSIYDVGANLAKYALAPGVASEAAGQLLEGSPYEGAARVVAGLSAGLGSDLAGAGARAGWNFAQPFTEKGQQAIAAQKLAGQFTDPDAAQRELASAAALQVPGQGLGEIVPGSRPTTGQLTGDLGALNFERGLATADPESFKSNDFGTGSVQQNSARTQALQAIQPTGSPEAVGQTVRDQLADIEATHSRAVSDALDQAQTAGAGIGTGAPPEQIGANLRGALQNARDDAKAKERVLWQAVDPDSSLALPSTPIADAATSIAKSIPSTAKPLAGEEGAIFNTAANLPPVIPFQDVTALRRRVSSAMRQELISAGQSPTYARLAQLRGAVENAISDAATHKAAQDGAAIAAGELPASDALSARWSNGEGAEESPISGLPAREASANASSLQAPGGDSSFGANGQGNPGFRDNAGNQGIPRSVSRPDGQVLGPGKVYHPNGSLDVNYELANLPDLVTSHDTNFRVNRAYPADLQPRAREQAPAQDQVNGMAAQLQPERLGRSPEANSGAPIVGPDNVVESGNGRTLALAKAYSAGRGGDYRQWLAAHGIDARGVPSPVLIARRVSPLSPEGRIAFAHSANTASGLAMTDGEKAFADARLMSPASIAHLSDAGLASEENQPFVRSFLAQLPAAERADLLDASGGLSQKGLRRLEMATMAKAYGDGDFIDKAFVARDLNVRGLAGALTDAAPGWLKMREAAREGLIDPAHDVTPALMTAARGIVRAREAGRPIAEVLNQGDLFGDEASAQAKAFLTNGKGQLANRQQIADRLRTYLLQSDPR